MRTAASLVAACALSLAGCAHYDGDASDRDGEGESSMFKFTGKRPSDLGVRDGRFTAAPTRKPNWVGSQVDANDAHYIAPIAIADDCASALRRLAQAIEAQPRTRIVERNGSYLYAEFSTALMGYVDDVELYCDGKVVHVRSSSRLGHSDLGVNRKRVEALRAAVGK